MHMAAMDQAKRGGATLAGAISEAVQRSLERTLLREIREAPVPVPRHVGIIMDGNRRYALERGLPAEDGHRMGRDTLEELLDWCLELDIRILTVYAFSMENFSRQPDEVAALMHLFEDNFRRMGDDERVHRHRIRVRAIGQRDLLPERVREAIRYAESRTEQYHDYRYNVAVAYGGRQEILQAFRDIAADVRDGRTRVEDIDEALLSKHLYTGDLPDPDLILRTSGEERISNFLLWQLAYAELYFTDIRWPGFRKLDFLRAIRTHQQRKRRFGS